MRFTLVFCTKNHVIQFFDGFAKSIETLRTSKRTSSSILYSWNGCQIKTPNCQRFKMSPAIQESCPLKIISVTVFWRKKHCLYNGFFPFSTMNSPICFVEFHTKTAWGLQDPQWRAFIRILFSKKRLSVQKCFVMTTSHVWKTSERNTSHQCWKHYPKLPLFCQCSACCYYL